MRIILCTCLIALLCISCDQKPKEDAELKELFTLMQGSFNSELQFKQDSSYYNISLHMYPIWKDKGNYLYVEQALNRAQDKPYRQRIYKVTRINDSLFSSQIFTIPNDSLWIGKWQNPEHFDRISTEYIEERKGCQIIMKRIGKNQFKGKTGANTCKSSLRGANYATSEVEITQGKIISWDRGFDAEGNHVWGATKGGYIFDKISPN